MRETTFRSQRNDVTLIGNEKKNKFSFCISLDFLYLCRMKKKIILALLMLAPLSLSAWHSIKAPNIKSLQVIKNDDFEALPVLQLHGQDVLSISFDELSHNYHRFIYRVEPCNPDWTPAEGLFESDWLEGLNNQPIEQYDNSINTTVLYTHYELQFPNEHTNLRMSGNYRLHIIDDDSEEEVLVVELRVAEPIMLVGLGITTNTDLDLNGRYQQVGMTVKLNGLRVTRPNEEIQTFVMQNGREDNMKVNVTPNYITNQSLQWEHNKHLIFDASNEYHKFEILDPRHTTMGLAGVRWDETTKTWHAMPMPCEPRRSYLYDEDTNGAFLLRNSDNYDAERTSDYVYVHYVLQPYRPYTDANIIVNGRWTTDASDNYVMTYNEESRTYDLTVMQKLGYYNYQLLLTDYDGTTHTLPEEGSFFQTENTYQAFVYYKATGARAWRLVGYQEVTHK